MTFLRSLRPGLSAQAWVAVACGFMALAVTFSSRASIGLVMPSLEAEFDASRSVLSVAAAVGLCVMGLLAVFTGYIADRFGPGRLLVIGLLVLAIAVGWMARELRP